MNTPSVKVTVNIPNNLVEFLKKFSIEKGITVTDALIRCIVDYRFLIEKQIQGNTILLEKSNGKLYKVFGI